MPPSYPSVCTTDGMRPTLKVLEIFSSVSITARRPFSSVFIASLSTGSIVVPFVVRCSVCSHSPVDASQASPAAFCADLISSTCIRNIFLLLTLILSVCSLRVSSGICFPSTGAPPWCSPHASRTVFRLRLRNGTLLTNSLFAPNFARTLLSTASL